MNDNIMSFSKNLLDYVNNSPTMYNAVNNLEVMLDNFGFKKLKLSEKWNLDVGGKYYLNINSSSFFAITIGHSNDCNFGFRIIGSHSDSPCFKIKPNSEISFDGGLKLNVEPYGGMIISSWLDRPLGIAGRVFMKNKDDSFNPYEYIISTDKAVCIIPNLAIHMNPTINTGYEYNKQIDVMPLVLETGKRIDECNYIKPLILSEISKSDDVYFNENDILDFELFLYEFEKGTLIGGHNEYISCGRLDNLASVYPSIVSLINSEQINKNHYNENDLNTINDKVDNKNDFIVKIAAVFNNEEIGSMSKEGADSNTLLNIMERISISLGKSRDEFLRSIESSFMLSADLSHALHPNKQDKSDINHKIIFGNGPAIKSHAGKAYASDSFSISVLKSILEKNNIKYQTFVNRSDMRSGATIGSIVTSHLSIPVVDVGMPILSMHSVRELGRVDDYYNYYKMMESFFNE